ncbi:tRNA (guanine-N(7)-)-methyltransferase [Citricoccus zhacaiensis]|uniref:tRNA (guanine-N(7)-)-methyltransferase n=1 Tax=Citricoccus zhacaiensis TaxID=489142 RepID=A0ABQ2M7B2_9MICC|nr:tRNA (guanosine(46)-N7)-methyltransferase TrmB [Citricoccus zhacaiensis]GGO47737.1 tRNA (guanine-N(7)-)-methyltransferase [Citricoccus zhacaiensis]
MTSDHPAPAQHAHGHNNRPDPELYRTEPVSFVRRGERLNPRRQKTWDRSHGKYIVDVPRDRATTSVAEGTDIHWDQVFGRAAPLVVDIGSGLGESTAQGAIDHPEWDFISVEVYTPGLAALLVRVEDGALENVRGVQANAPEVLDRLLPAGGVQEIWVFFPDPWHKTRHHKRRLVSPAFADRVARVLAPGGVLRLATDWSSYAVHMRSAMEAHPQLANAHPGRATGEDSPLTRVRLEGRELEVGAQPIAPRTGSARAGVSEASSGAGLEDPVDHEGGWAPRFEGRPLTSFENKALRAGRLVFDLTYVRL